MTKTLTLLAGLCLAGSLTASRPADPETVMVTFRARPGAELELARVIANHWATARRLDLVRPEPHVTLSAKDAGGTYYVDVFTWRDASIPDNAPAEITKIWEDMNRLTEARGGHPALIFTEVTVVAPETKPAS